ncbi:GNAT family N-acetyltransferase [Permianibacter sp. IMCC34836]|uniref:GNAT family N-acetyltransferase n=1 Tax=Permianibacter fluminis TaxID=2738515 RepID=UPI001557FDCE|nr:GNAT family N-acetyltransferase [Permianibacter fluminis]NQD38052.1 GNAT family N-acetyltransferase [Permianibacter fluminis]
MNPTSSGELAVRLATAADLPFIVRGACALAEQEAEQGAALTLQADFPQRVERYFADLIASPTALVILAERQQQPLAYIAGSLQSMPNDFTTAALYGMIQVLWVEPDARRLQLGKTLVEMFEATLRDQGVHHIDTQHAHSNLPAVLFWQSCGYAPVSTTLRKML